MDCFQPIECNGLNQLRSKIYKLYKTYPDQATWMFRGQSSAEWYLKTSLERTYEQFHVDLHNKEKIEKNMIREFKRRIHHYTSNVPDDDAIDEWLALMQHYGAPTRLLDFTYSPYIAAYFAFEKAESNDHVAIWAINTALFTNILQNKYPDFYQEYDEYRIYRQSSKKFKEIFFPSDKTQNRHLPTKLIASINPFRLNERLVYQRGVFLAPLNIQYSFMDNLRDYVGAEYSHLVIKYVLYTGKRNQKTIEALELLSDMNVSRNTLFPGLDGFAQSFAPRTMTLFWGQDDYPL